MNLHISMSDRAEIAKSELRAAKRKLVGIERQIAATQRRQPAKGETAKWRQILAGHEGARKRVQSDIVAATQKVAEVAAEYKMYLAGKAERETKRKAQNEKNRRAANARRETIAKTKATNEAKSLVDTITDRIKRACQDGNIAIIPQLDRELCAAQALAAK